MKRTRHFSPDGLVKLHAQLCRMNAARNAKLSPERRSEIARQAGIARAVKAGQRLVRPLDDDRGSGR